MDQLTRNFVIILLNNCKPRHTNRRTYDSNITVLSCYDITLSSKTYNINSMAPKGSIAFLSPLMLGPKRTCMCLGLGVMAISH